MWKVVLDITAGMGGICHSEVIFNRQDEVRDWGPDNVQSTEVDKGKATVKKQPVEGYIAGLNLEQQLSES